MDTTDKRYFSYHITQRFLMAMDRILGERQGGKVTAKSFGDIVGISSSNINRLRSSAGENTVTLEAVARICDRWKISPYWLMTGHGEMYTNAELYAAYETLEARLKDVEVAVKSIEETVDFIFKNKENRKGLPVNKNVNKISQKRKIK